MSENKLFVVYLGGKVAEGRMGEDHEVVVVVASDVTGARKAAKAKWCGIGDPHVDAVLDVGAMSCPDHKRYQAKRKPRAACEACWRMWIKAQDAAMIYKPYADRAPLTVPVYCTGTIPGHHLEECVRANGHDGECSSSAMDLGK